MAFPYLFHENFETGTLGGFSSESDDLGRLDFPGQEDRLNISSYRGTHCMRITMSRDTLAAYVQHDTVFDMIPGDPTRYLRFYLYVGNDFIMTQGNSLKLVSIFSGGGTELEEVSIGISRSDVQLRTHNLAIWSPDDNEFIDGIPIDIGRWMCIQMTVSHASTTGRCFLQQGDNTIQVGRMQFQPFTHFRMGSMAQSPDCRGTLYFDEVIIDSDKLHEPEYVDRSMLPYKTVLYQKSGFLFTGPGEILSATLIAGGTNNLVRFFNADQQPFAFHTLKAVLKASSVETRETVSGVGYFTHGCYLEMTGTGPQVLVHYGQLGNVNLAPQPLDRFYSIPLPPPGAEPEPEAIDAEFVEVRSMPEATTVPPPGFET